MSIRSVLAEEEEQSKGPVYKRILYLIIIVAIATAVGLLLLRSQYGVNTQLLVYSNQIGNQVSEQYSLLIQQAIIEKDDKRLSQIISNLRNQPNILDAALFDKSGVIIVPFIDQKTYIETKIQNINRSSITFVVEINVEDSTVGYLNVQFDHKAIVESQNQIKEYYDFQSSVLMMLCFALGILVSRHYYLWKIKKKYHVKNKIENL